MNDCHLCQTPTVKAEFDCGMQPICNRFLRNAHEPEALFPLVVGQCQSCGLVQISQPVPAEELRPRFDWINYREPEEDLEAVIDRVLALTGIASQASVGAMVVAGDTTVRRFQNRGFKSAWGLDLKDDLGEADPCAGTETMQQRFTLNAARTITQRRGRCDVFVVRYVLEHAHCLHEFLAAVKLILNPDGLVVFEVPDCERPFANCDYTILWEEHVFYFTQATFLRTLEAAGFEVLESQRTATALIALARPARETVSTLPADTEMLASEKARVRSFAESFPGRCQAVAKFLAAVRAREGAIAFFGAGHLACDFENQLELKQHLDSVVDDHPQKAGMFMPGSRLPILAPSGLAARGVRVCLSALSAEVEEKITRSNPGFEQSGARFVSIFAERRNSLPV